MGPSGAGNGSRREGGRRKALSLLRRGALGRREACDREGGSGGGLTAGGTHPHRRSDEWRLISTSRWCSPALRGSGGLRLLG